MTQTDKIRVLVVDDSVLVRKMISEALAEHPSIEIVGTAANGKLGLRKIIELSPDVVTLDIEMPEMDGLTLLDELRSQNIEATVIMCSSLTARGAQVTLEALARGAMDYFSKPSSFSVGGLEWHQELTEKVVGLGRRKKKGATSAPLSAPATQPISSTAATTTPPRRTPPEAFVIGVSTGGPGALSALLPELPASFPLPIFIVQHMPPLFTKMLAERLDSKSPLKIIEAEDNTVVSAGNVYIAPGGRHMTVDKSGTGRIAIHLNDNPPEHSCRPAVEVLFRSAADVYGSSLVSLILTGMGADGSISTKYIRDKGGLVLAQDEATSVVWGMPGAVVSMNTANEVLPLHDIGKRLKELANLRG